MIKLYLSVSAIAVVVYNVSASQHSCSTWQQLCDDKYYCPQYYEEVWSNGAVELLDGIMAEAHEQHDKILQPGKISVGRSSMAKGIVGYRRAYPDLKYVWCYFQLNKQRHSC